MLLVGAMSILNGVKCQLRASTVNYGTLFKQLGRDVHSVKPMRGVRCETRETSGVDGMRVRYSQRALNHLLTHATPT